MDNLRKTESFLSKTRANTNFLTQDGLELKTFRSCLKWVGLDQSSIWRASFSWSIFFLLAIGNPLISHFVLLCSDCDFKHQRPYDAVVQTSLSVFATVSFISLFRWSHKYGIKKFLFLDKLSDLSDQVREGYTQELQKSMKLLLIFVLPSFALESIYRIWWYITGASEIPYFGNIYISHFLACTLQLSSWLYRTTIFILVCILYQLSCYLQILRLKDFAQFFHQETDVSTILREHLKIRRNLRVISHRFRAFILLSLVLVTGSQFMSLLMTIRSGTPLNIYEAGELALCSISLVTGLFICLRSATKITHNAQSITSLAAKWNVCATLDSFDDLDGETPRASTASNRMLSHGSTESASDEEEDIDDGDLDNTKMIPVYANTISFQKRQAIVTYLENNRAGITVFGFMVDRSWLHTIFGIELALLLWLLNKTIGMS